MRSLKQLPRRSLLSLIALLIAAVSLTALPAAAATPDPGYDGNVHLLQAEGAVTPYLMNQQIDSLYNGSPGCTLDANPTGFNFNNCQVTTLATAPVGANFDHNVVSRAFQITSGNGLSMLQHTAYPGVVTPTVAAGHRVDIADTNRAPVTDTSIPQVSPDPAGLTWFSTAKDAQALWTFKGRTMANSVPLGFSLATLQHIFLDCTITTWSQIPGAFVTDTASIDLYGPAFTAGTYVDVTRYLFQGIPNAAATFPNGMNQCILSRFGSSHLITVNNSAPIEADPQGANALWWASNGVLTTHPPLRGTGSAWTLLDGVVLNNATTSCFSSITSPPTPDTCDPANGGPGRWPVQQAFFDVSLSAANTAAPAVNPGTDPPGIGQLGAVRAYRDWVCKTTTASITNPTTGRKYRVDIVSKVTVEGFVAPPPNQTSQSTDPGNVNPSTGASDSCIWFTF
jgi:hypothetical protein